MKKRFLLFSSLILVFCFSAIRAADIRELFLKMPDKTLENINRAESIIENESRKDFLKLKFPDGFAGEFKILADKNREIIAGFSIYSCAQSDIKIWSVKRGIWKEITASSVPKLGEKDVVEMLKISPATISNLNEEAAIPYFYTFSPTDLSIKFVVRKQENCEIAGTVYDYKFNGKKFTKNK